MSPKPLGDEDAPMFERLKHTRAVKFPYARPNPEAKKTYRVKRAAKFARQIPQNKGD